MRLAVRTPTYQARIDEFAAIATFSAPESNRQQPLQNTSGPCGTRNSIHYPL